ncbi:DUF1294 domain-containing protein [Deinococcus deserti]|nr:DUF1294 domain-containing protein [Deinococcus deserti]
MVAFIAMGHDKRLATQLRRRTPEKNLHRLEAWGGWAGSLAAQLLLRHKTRKASYQRIYRPIALGWVTACAVVGTLHLLQRFYI